VLIPLKLLLAHGVVQGGEVITPCFHDQGLQLNQAMFLLMTEGDPAPLMQLTKQLMDAALAALAKEAWGYHLAALHDAMSEEQFERYQHRSAA
jgi:hypothetical protein